MPLCGQKFTLVDLVAVDLLRTISLKASAVFCHLILVPMPLSVFSNRDEISMKTFPIFIIYSTKVLWEPIEVAIQEMDLDTHILQARFQKANSITAIKS